jgi:tetratricopeptide (TPR) repeat protein
VDRLPRLLPEVSAAVLAWPGTRDGGYGRAIEAAERRLLIHARALAAERAEAPACLAELLVQPPERREMLIRNHPRFQTWGLLEGLVKRLQEQVFEYPEAGEDLARLALSLADSLAADHYGTERIEDLRGRIWGYVGNARRTRFDLRGAEKAFQKAMAHLRTGTGDPLERALLLDLRASLLRDQRRLDVAMRLLRRAFRLYCEVGETHRAGRVLVKMSTLHEHAGTPELGIPLLHEARKLIDAEREPRLLLNAEHNLITCLAEAGRFMEAHGLFIQARPLYARFPDGWTQNRRRWLEGRITRGLGQAREAEVHLRAARDGFVGEKAAFDTALVSLDLAALYAEQGRTVDLKRISEEMLAIFSSQQIYREALASLALLQQAVAAERASLAEVTRMVGHLKRLIYASDLP